MRERERWVCPKCGRRLRIANQEHVCGLFDLDSRFERKDPLGRIAFDWMLHSLGKLPYDLLPMKTMIAFAAGEGNFAFLRTKKWGAEISLVLQEAPSGPSPFASVPYSRSKTIYRFRVGAESDLDGALRGLLLSAYRPPNG